MTSGMLLKSVNSNDPLRLHPALNASLSWVVYQPPSWLHPTASLMSREDSQNCRKLQRTPEECWNRAVGEEIH